MLSRDGRWLYYDSDLSGNMDLYRMALPAGAPERLTSDSSDDFWPAPSPDGREVAFHSWRGGSRDIWVMPLDGGPLQRVTSSPAQEAMAAWAPDGNRLAYCHLHRPGRHLDGAPRVSGRLAEAGRAARLGVLPQLVARRPDPVVQQLAHPRSALGHAGRLGRAPARWPTPPGPGRCWGDRAQWSDDGRAVYTRSTDSTGTHASGASRSTAARPSGW